MARQYFFLSDLHIGGDGPLNVCDFEEELINFLRMLENEPPDTELMLVGDIFGLWEFTSATGREKLTAIVASHRRLFDQFIRTGSRIRISMIPGNHDYDLACDPGFVPMLAELGIVLEPVASTTREILGRKLWIEHGSQYDSANCSPGFGNPLSLPLGFHIVQNIVLRFAQASRFGRGDWLKDLRGVHPYEAIPHWMFSNYFYREMAPFLRYGALPFLLMFAPAAVFAAGLYAERWGLLTTRFFTNLESSLVAMGGMFGGVISAFLLFNVWVVTLVVVAAIPSVLIYRDLKRTFSRYGLQKAADLTTGGQVYIEAARRVFTEHPDVSVFIYGHTHRPSLTWEQDRVILNTGTWLRELRTVPTWFRFLPDVYYPFVSLGYFKIYALDQQIAIDYKVWPCRVIVQYTALERLLTFQRSAAVPIGAGYIPEQVCVDVRRDAPFSDARAS